MSSTASSRISVAPPRSRCCSSRAAPLPRQANCCIATILRTTGLRNWHVEAEKARRISAPQTAFSTSTCRRASRCGSSRVSKGRWRSSSKPRPWLTADPTTRSATSTCSGWLTTLTGGNRSLHGREAAGSTSTTPCAPITWASAAIAIRRRASAATSATRCSGRCSPNTISPANLPARAEQAADYPARGQRRSHRILARRNAGLPPRRCRAL